MAKQILDFDIFDGTLDGGSTETLRVKTRRAERVAFFANDGETLDEPELYDAEVRIEHIQELGNPLTLLDDIDSTEQTVYETYGYGQFMEVVFENSTGNPQDYRFILKSYRQVEG